MAATSASARRTSRVNRLMWVGHGGGRRGGVPGEQCVGELLQAGDARIGPAVIRTSMKLL
jgi:hypothetical protein